MKIKYLGHSSFLLTSSNGSSVVCDPYDGRVGFQMPKVFADAVTLSHHHYDHDAVESVGGNPKVIEGLRRCKVGDIEISAVASFHDNRGGSLRGENVIYKYVVGGVTVCHLGDLGEDFNGKLVEAIGRVDVLLIPVGGNYTINASTAKKYVDAIDAKIVVPMHYKVDGLNIDIDGVDKFLKLYGSEQIVPVEGEIQLSHADMCDPIKIFVMKRWVG